MSNLSRIAKEWERTFDTVDDPLFIVDTQQKIVRLNRAAARLTGHHYQEQLGQGLHKILFGTKVPEETSPLIWRPEEESTKRFESSSLLPEGIYEVVGIPVVDEAGVSTSSIFVVRNITQRKALETSLRENSKMSALGIMAGGIAHDFNNILSAILGYAEILKLKLKDNQRQTNYALEIIKAGERGATLIRSLMTYSRKDVQQAESVDLNLLLLELNTMMVRLVGEDIDIAFNLIDGPATFWGQRGQIEQVVINLVVNAKDALSTGGTITVSTSLGVADSPQQPASIILQIQDTGHGMTVETAEKIFDPFYTTKPLGKGTGLGLSIVQGIIHSHGGEISVLSRPGQGTTFTILLPESQESGKPTQKPNLIQDSRPKTTSKDIRILLVDDDAAVRNASKSVLEEFGWDVTCAEGPAEALQVFKRMQDEITLLITDVIMPVMNGYELAQKFQEIRPNLKVVYLSGYSSEALQSKGVMSADLPILEKPFSPIELCNVIDKIAHTH